MPEANLRFLPAAQTDLIKTANWYERQASGLGVRFLSAVDETIKTIVDHPELFSVRFKHLRRAPVHSFPYGVWYCLTNKTILIAAIFHGRRNPKVLERRT